MAQRLWSKGMRERAAGTLQSLLEHGNGEKLYYSVETELLLRALTGCSFDRAINPLELRFAVDLLIGGRETGLDSLERLVAQIRAGRHYPNPPKRQHLTMAAAVWED